MELCKEKNKNYRIENSEQIKEYRDIYYDNNKLKIIDDKKILY